MKFKNRFEIMKVFLLTCLGLIAFLPMYPQPFEVNIAELGADNYGKIKCTAIINSTIDSLSKSGGGTLYFPPGTYYTGPVIFKSNITLYLDAGATIQFSDDFDDYLPMVTSRWEEIRVKNFISQFYAYQCKNIAIRGDGHINGNGKKWWDFWNSVKDGKVVDSRWQNIFREENTALLNKNEYLRNKNAFLRPHMFLSYECSDVLIEGVSLSNPPFWTIAPTFSDNVTIKGITIENPDYSPNTDGIDISSCTNVHISDCHISVGDDCIVIKSGRDEDGREAGKPSENIAITNCTMLKGHGGVVIGSETSGDVRRVAISNCVFEGTDVGIRIKTMRGRGGIVEEIRVSNILMYDMVKEGIIITMRYQPTNPEPVSERTPVVRNVHFSGISMNNAERAIAIYGLEEKEIAFLTFNDMHIVANNGILLENAADISFYNVNLEIAEGTPFVARDSRTILYDRVTLKNPSGDPVISLAKCSTVIISNCYQPGIISRFLEHDESTYGLCFINNVMQGVSELYHKGNNKTTLISNIYNNLK